MGLSNIVRSRSFKNFMSKLYGWGASVVILGALFKINHYPGADYMLIVGLGTEAIIFFFSAFEPPYVDPDWSLVYPELAGLYGHGNVNGDMLTKRKNVTDELDDMLAEAKIDQNLINKLGIGLQSLSENASKLADISDAANATNEFVDNVRSASKGADELSKSYVKTSEVLNRDLETTEEHFANLKSASDNVASLSSTYEKASESLQGNLSAAEEFSSSIKNAASSASSLANSYSNSAEKISQSIESLDLTGEKAKNYNEQLKRIGDNLAALNSIYELQLQGSNENVETNNKLQVTMNELLASLKESVENTGKYHENVSALNEKYVNQLENSEKQIQTSQRLQETLDMYLQNLTASIEMTTRYKDEVDKLVDNVAALNKVYGNMLSAMNVTRS